MAQMALPKVPLKCALLDTRFAAVHESPYGTSRHFAAPQNLSPIGLTTDKGWRRASIDTQRLTQSGQYRNNYAA
jgi:hypothetical protein